jgi:hypothetical protein
MRMQVGHHGVVHPQPRLERRSTLLVAAGTLTLGSAVVGMGAPDLAPVLIGMMGVGATLAVSALRSATVRLPIVATYVSVGMAATLSGLVLFGRTLAPVGTWSVLALTVFVVLALLAARPRSGRQPAVAMALLTVSQAGVLLRFVATQHPPIDVQVFLTQASRAILHAHNPYTAAYPDIYGPQQSALLYGPGVVGHDGLLNFGFPYPPASLLLAIPAHLLGDVRIAPIVVVLTLSLVLHLTGAPAQRGAAVLLACAPGFAQLVVNGWTEGAIVGVVAAAVWLAARRQWLPAAALLGVALASKQYFVVALPALWLLRPYASKARVAVMLGAASVVTLPFLAWDPQAFWRAVVQFQLVQPFRPDSISLLVWSVNHFGWPGPAAFSIPPLAAGMFVAVLTARRLRPGIPSFLTATSLSLLATTALSKQAFINYYFLIGCLLLLAAWAVSTPRSPQPKTAAIDRYAARSGERAAYLMRVTRSDSVSQ